MPARKPTVWSEEHPLAPAASARVSAPKRDPMRPNRVLTGVRAGRVMPSLCATGGTSFELFGFVPAPAVEKRWNVGGIPFLAADNGLYAAHDEIEGGHSSHFPEIGPRGLPPGHEPGRVSGRHQPRSGHRAQGQH